MKLFDAHHHLWIPEKEAPAIGYGWLKDIGAIKPFGDPTPIQRNYEWAEYSAESHDHELVGSVYVQVDGAIGDPVASWSRKCVARAFEEFDKSCRDWMRAQSFVLHPATSCTMLNGVTITACSLSGVCVLICNSIQSK